MEDEEFSINKAFLDNEGHLQEMSVLDVWQDAVTRSWMVQVESDCCCPGHQNFNDDQMRALRDYLNENVK